MLNRLELSVFVFREFGTQVWIEYQVAFCIKIFWQILIFQI